MSCNAHLTRHAILKVLTCYPERVKMTHPITYAAFTHSTRYSIIHSEKTKVVVFGTPKRVKKAGHIHLRMNNEPIQQVPSYKYLGMILDSSLSYKPHLATVSDLYHTKLIYCRELGNSCQICLRCLYIKPWYYHFLITLM